MPLTFADAAAALNNLEQLMEANEQRHVARFRAGRGDTAIRLAIIESQSDDLEGFLHAYVRAEFDRVMGTHGWGFRGKGRYGVEGVPQHEARFYLRALCRQSKQDYGHHLRAESR